MLSPNFAVRNRNYWLGLETTYATLVSLRLKVVLTDESHNVVSNCKIYSSINLPVLFLTQTYFLPCYPSLVSDVNRFSGLKNGMNTKKKEEKI